MLVTTTEQIAGHRIIESKGQVFGVVVRSRGLAGNLLAGLRSIFGGEIPEYTSLLEQTRRHALDRMVKNAQLMGGNAVVMICVLFERSRYRHAQADGRGKWERTGERFVDPESGEAMEVLYDPVSGERRYVRVGDEAR